MSEITDVDVVMSEIGMRVANELVGKSPQDNDIDSILVKSLEKANEAQRYEVVDNMIDLLAVSQVLQKSLSDGNLLDAGEIEELMEYMDELTGDTKASIKDLVNNQ